MVTVDLFNLLSIAQSTNAFSVAEMDVLREVLEKSTPVENSPLEAPVPDYILIEEKSDFKTVGFVIFGKVPMTQSSWDIYWIATRKDCQGRGVGRALVKKVEAYLLEREGFAHIRLETSSRKDYDNTRNFYLKAGFKESGRIPDFYSVGDSLVTFYKKIEPAL